MYEVELFHQLSSRILRNVCTDSVYQNQTVQFDVGSVLPVNLVDIFCQTYNFEMAIFRFDHMLERFINFFSRLRIKLNYKRTRCNS